MTDKQIIIDVCPYQGECSVSGCKRNDDGCFVRQLFEERNSAENRIVELNKTIEAKEQECEELKENLPNAITRLMGELDQLKEELAISIQENEEGREINAELKTENEELKEQFKLAEPLYQACNIKDKKINKLKQTLTEIKEIAEKHAPRCNDDAECDFECEACHLQDLKQILQKCEVLDE